MSDIRIFTWNHESIALYSQFSVNCNVLNLFIVSSILY